VNTFVHTFDEYGVYHFVDHSDEDNSLIVGVQETCDPNYPIQPRTESSLSYIGAKSRTEIIYDRDYLEIGLTVMFVMIIIIGCTFCLALYYFKEWAPQFFRNK